MLETRGERKKSVQQELPTVRTSPTWLLCLFAFLVLARLHHPFFTDLNSPASQSNVLKCDDITARLVLCDTHGPQGCIFRVGFVLGRRRDSEDRGEARTKGEHKLNDLDVGQRRPRCKRARQPGTPPDTGRPMHNAPEAPGSGGGRTDCCAGLGATSRRFFDPVTEARKCASLFLRDRMRHVYGSATK